jgi:hypothetical protein
MMRIEDKFITPANKSNGYQQRTELLVSFDTEGLEQLFGGLLPADDIMQSLGEEFYFCIMNTMNDCSKFKRKSEIPSGIISEIEELYSEHEISYDTLNTPVNNSVESRNLEFSIDHGDRIQRFRIRVELTGMLDKTAYIYEVSSVGFIKKRDL